MPVDCLSAGILVADHLCAPISHVPAAGELILTDELPLRIGGCAANVAIDLARLGTRVGVLGCVGADAFGNFVIDTLRGQGVDAEAVRRLPGVGTSGTLIINVAGEDRRFIHTIGANAHFTADELPGELIGEAKVLYIGGYLLLKGMDPRRLAERFHEARQAGVTTVLDIVLPGAGDHWAALEPVLAETDVFLPNDFEAAAITGFDDPVAQAERFHAAGAKTVVITCGEKGSVLISDEVRLRAGVFDVDFVGGTGAGDAFDAGYIAGLLAGEPPERCLQWGSALGASCVRHVSATDGVFNRNEAEQFLARHPLRIERI